MREPNHNFPTQNKACVCITSQLYDRRALDGPLPTLPLVSSLTHLSFLTSTSPRIREILTLDGGLERLVAIVAGSLDAAARAASPSAATANDLRAASQGGAFRSFASYSKKSSVSNNPSAFSENQLAAPKGSVSYSRSLLITYTLSIQALCNVGVRGTEPVRTRVVEAGVLKVAARVLKSFLDERDRKAGQLADQVKQQFKSIRSSTWESGNTTEFSAAVVQEVHVPIASSSSANNVSLSVPNTQPPSRTSSPDGMLQPSASSSNVNLLYTVGSAEDLAGSSDGDQEREEDELVEAPEQDAQSLAALQCRGRARSLTVKAGPAVVPNEDNANGDTEMTEDVRAESQPMDLDDDLETVIGGHSIAPEHNSPIRENILLRSPVPTYPLSLSNQDQQPSATLSPAPSTSGSASPSYQLPEDGFRFREEEVLTCLQLLAYLSKYPHVRAVFHDPDSDYACSTFNASPLPPQAPADKSNNIFSLVEKFTFRPAPGDRITPRLPTDIQYWAGVIMRNACRKDEARDGVRQCANMQCGEWEKFPREFAKCRRCRKAKYCSKTCQSKAWQGGHRYWCSAKDGAEPHSHSSRSGERREGRSIPVAPAPRRRPRAMTDPRAANAAVVRAAATIVEGVSPELAAQHRFNEDDAAEEIVEEHHDAGVEIAGMGRMQNDLLRRIASEGGVEDDLALL